MLFCKKNFLRFPILVGQIVARGAPCTSLMYLPAWWSIAWISSIFYDCYYPVVGDLLILLLSWKKLFVVRIILFLFPKKLVFNSFWSSWVKSLMSYDWFKKPNALVMNCLFTRGERKNTFTKWSLVVCLFESTCTRAYQTSTSSLSLFDSRSNRRKMHPITYALTYLELVGYDRIALAAWQQTIPISVFWLAPFYWKKFKKSGDLRAVSGFHLSVN
mgnify:CR=1 FL=1